MKPLFCSENAPRRCITTSKSVDTSLVHKASNFKVRPDQYSYSAENQDRQKSRESDPYKIRMSTTVAY